MELYEKFQQAYQRGRERDLTNLDDYLSQFKINYKDFVQLFEVDRALKATILEGLVVNRLNELEKIAMVLGSYEKKPRRGYINIIALPQTGKTLFLNLIQHYFIRTSGENAGKGKRIKIYDATLFSEQEVEEDRQGIFYFDEIITVMKKHDIILVDNCDRDLEHMRYNIRRMEEELSNKLIILAWGAISWLKFTEENMDSTISYVVDEPETTLVLEPLEKDEIVELLQIRLKGTKKRKDLKPLTKELLEEIAKASYGIPGLSLRLLYLLIREGSYANQDPIEDEQLIAVLRREGLFDIEHKMKDLNEISYRILYRIATSSSYRGINATDLSRVMERDRSTIAYYLNEMLKLRLLESSKFGKYTFFRVRPSILPVVHYYIWNTRRDYDE